MMDSSPLYEGDTVTLSCLYAGGVVFSLPPSSSYSSVSIYPDQQEDRPNVHTVAFQVLPEYANVNVQTMPPVSVIKEEDRPYLRYKLVYGRKIKLLHVASKKYLSLPDRAQNDNETKPGFLDDQAYLFRILPATDNKTRGDTIMSGDHVKLESVLRRGHHILCVRNALSGNYELKMAITNSVFSVVSQTVCDCSLSPKAIRGGSVVRFANLEKDGYLCGTGSTVADILPPGLEHDNKTDVYLRKKKSSLVPRPPPVSGDSWWQLEKCDNPLSGSAFKNGEKCHIRHLPTQKYLAIGLDQQVILASMTDINTLSYNYTFYLKDAGNGDNGTDVVLKGSLITISDDPDDSKCDYIKLNETKWEYVESKALGTIKFPIYLDKRGTDTRYMNFKIDEVRPEDLYRMYYLDSAKQVLIKFLKKLQVDTNVVLVELTEVLSRLLNIVQNGSTVSLKKCAKMFRASHCGDLMVGFLALELEDKNIYINICRVLEAFANVKSPRCHWYLAKRSFLDVYFSKLGYGVGMESFLIALVEDESAIAQKLVDHFVGVESAVQGAVFKNLDAAGLKLLSTLCFINGYPEESLQNVICERIITEKGNKLFYTTETINDVVYYVSPGDKSENTKLLSELCSPRHTSKEKSFKFFVAQLSLFSRVCKGVNRTAIKIVSQWFPFEQSLVVLGNPNIHSVAKSAFLELIISVYLDEVIASSGVDIDSIWNCYLWERLAPDTSLSISCQPLEGSNVKQNLVEHVQNSQEVGHLLDIIKDELRDDNLLRLLDASNHEYLNQILAALEPLVAYGFCWNVSGETTFSVHSLVNILSDGKLVSNGNGGSSVLNYTDGEMDQMEEDTEEDENERFLATVETLPVFKIKARTLRLLELFFKQFIYLSLEQFLYEFRAKKDNPTQIEDFMLRRITEASFEEDISFHMNILSTVGSSQPSLFYQLAHRKLRKIFEFEEYRSFDIKKQEGQTLVRILQNLMKYDDDELRTTSAALLYDIYSKEHLMFAKARLSYIVEGDRDVYDEMVSYGSFNDEFRIMKALLQGRAPDIEDEAGVSDTLESMVFAMVVQDDETEVNSSSQNIAFTTGVFASLMNYVLKFCVTNDNDDQKPYIKASCEVLKMICRANPKNQRRIAESLSDFMKVKTGVSSVARLLTEVFTDNEDICRDVSYNSLRQLFKVAAAYSNKEGEEERDKEHMQFFTALEALMRPIKLTGAPLKIVQGNVIHLFDKTDFGDLLMKDDDNNTISDNRRNILEKSDNDSAELLKLLHLTDLMASCCHGQIKSAEDICRDIYSLEELVDIVTSTSITPVRKIPFARLLVGAYLSTERETMPSLHLLAQNLEFWNHIHQFTAWIEPLAEKLSGDEVKFYLRKISEYYQTWEETFNTEGETETLFVLRYFIEGLGPLITTFCNELSSYKHEKLTKIEYGKIINPRGNTLKELGAALVGLLTGKDRKSLMLSNKTLSTFWTDCLESIDKVLPESPHYHVITQDYQSEDNFYSAELLNHFEEMSVRTKINEDFQQFITNFKKIYEWKNPNNASAFSEDLISCQGLMPRGPSFIKLLDKFPITISEIPDEDSMEDDVKHEANVNSTCILLDLLEVLYRQLRHPMTSKDRTRLQNTLCMTLQVLFGIVYTRIENVNVKYQILATLNEIKPIQDALTINESTIGVKEKCGDLTLKHLHYHNDTVAMHILSVLYILVFTGNVTTQNIIHALLTENTYFFVTLQRFIGRIVIQFGQEGTMVAVEDTIKSKEVKQSSEQQLLRQETLRSRHGTETHLQIEDIAQQHETIPLFEMPPSSPEVSPPHAKEETDHPSAKKDFDKKDSDKKDSDKKDEKPIDIKLTEGDKEALSRIGLVLDLTSQLCDGQNRKLQALMREQTDYSVTSINIISGTAALLQSLAELPLSKEIPEQKEQQRAQLLIVETITKSLQALIEMCAGNYKNQQVAMDGQVVDSINLILDKKFDKKCILHIKMQCKSIELLQVLLEETDEKSKAIVKAISKDLKKLNIINFIENTYNLNKALPKEDADFVSRGMYRAYQIVRSLADYDKKAFRDFAELGQKAKSEMWKHLDENTAQIEINYITKEGKEILSRVYFPLDSSHKMTDDEKDKMQADLNRDSPEDKMRDLIEWTDSVWKNDLHKAKLRKYFILTYLLFLSTLRHWGLILLTILLNIFVLGVFEIPSATNCNNDNSSAAGHPLIIPRPWDCWSSPFYIVLYILGSVHLILAVWMVLEYFIKEAPNFIFYVPFVKKGLYRMKILVNESSWADSLGKTCYTINQRAFRGYFKLDWPTESQCFDIYFFGPYPMYRILFLISSILGLSTYGYFYCLCLPYVFIKVDVILHVVKAIGGKAKQLIFVALLILCLLLIYAVLSFAIMSSFFDLSNNLYCRTLFECYVTVIREGLVNSFGEAIPVKYVGQSGSNFNVYLWRTVIDISYFAVVSVVALEVITAILVDRFSEIRAERDAAIKDQKDVCYVCGIASDIFEREGTKGRGFWEHYHEDHNVYNYIYYVLYIRSIPTQDHNAIEKYVYDMMEAKSIEFYPIRKAKVLGGSVGSDASELVDDIKSALEKYEGQD